MLVEWLLGAGYNRDAGAERRLTGSGLASHQRNRFRGRSNEAQPGVAARSCEVLILRKKAVAWMDTIGTGLCRRIDNRVDPQITLARRIGSDRPSLIRQTHVQRGAVAI